MTDTSMNLTGRTTIAKGTKLWLLVGWDANPIVEPVTTKAEIAVRMGVGFHHWTVFHPIRNGFADYKITLFPGSLRPADEGMSIRQPKQDWVETKELVK